VFRNPSHSKLLLPGHIRPRLPAGIISPGTNNLDGTSSSFTSLELTKLESALEPCSICDQSSCQRFRCQRSVLEFFALRTFFRARPLPRQTKYLDGFRVTNTRDYVIIVSVQMVHKFPVPHILTLTRFLMNSFVNRTCFSMFDSMILFLPLVCDNHQSRPSYGQATNPLLFHGFLHINVLMNQLF